MAGMYTDPGDKDGGKGLPEGHWMHGVMAKEKARLAKKKARDTDEGGVKKQTSPASVQAVSMTPVAGGAPC